MNKVCTLLIAQMEHELEHLTAVRDAIVKHTDEYVNHELPVATEAWLVNTKREIRDLQATIQLLTREEPNSHD